MMLTWVKTGLKITGGMIAFIVVLGLIISTVYDNSKGSGNSEQTPPAYTYHAPVAAPIVRTTDKCTGDLDWKTFITKKKEGVNPNHCDVYFDVDKGCVSVQTTSGEEVKVCAGQKGTNLKSAVIESAWSSDGNEAKAHFMPCANGAPTPKTYTKCF